MVLLLIKVYCEKIESNNSGGDSLENRFVKLQKEVIHCSSNKNWYEAVQEWDIVDFAEDSDRQESCKCGKPNIKYLYTISNRVTNEVLEPIGSQCIKKFERKDLKEEISIYEQLFKLVNARRDKKFIALKSDEKYFSKKLIDYLHSQNVFTISGQYNNYEILRKFFAQRKPLTDKQDKLSKRIIITDVFKYLDSEIENRVKAKSEK